MKQTKRLLALILSVVLLVGLMPTRALAEEIGASQSEEPPGDGDAPVTPVEGATPTEPEGTNVTEPPEVTEPEIVTEPPEETAPTEPAEPVEPTELSGEPEETLAQDAEVDEFTQEQFLEEYAAAGTYALTEAMTLTAGLRLDHPLIVHSGGSLTVPTGITLTVAGALTLDGGSVRVQSGGTLILEAEGQIDIQRGLLKVAPGGSFVSDSDTPAISVAPGSGSVEGIELDAPAAPEGTEVPTEPEAPVETEVPTELEITEETKAPTELDISEEAGAPTEPDAALEIPTIRIQARVAGSGVQERIDLIRSVYPTDSYFTSTGQSHDTNSSACPAQPGSGMPYSTCACSLSQITAKPTSGLYSGAEVYQKIGKADRWQCKAFATYAFYNIFGQDVTSASCIRIDQTEPKLGDVISFNGTFLSGYHAGIYLGTSGSNLIVYDANVDYCCKVRYGSVKSYDPTTTYVYHASNYDEVNGAPSYDYSSVFSGTYYLENAASGKYLSIDNSGDGNGVNISVAERQNSDGMRFQITDAADGYVMRPLCSSRIVNANGTAPGSGANIDLWDDLSDSSQWWKFETVNGGYIIHSVFNSSCVLDTDGSNVRLAIRNGNASQIWVLKTQSEAEYQSPSTDDYRDWYNYDPRWADIPLGSGGSTVGAAGCLVNAATKLMIQAGLKSADTCDVGTFVRWANSNGGFEPGTGNMYWGAVDRFCGFVNQGHLLEGSFSSSAYNDTIISWIRQGYHMVIGVNGNGHWVAVDEATSLRTGTVYIWDSYPDPTIRTGITLASRFETFSTVHAWTGGTTPSPTPSYTLDLNGFLDGQQCTDISGHGTVDVYINGALAASGVSDYYTELPSGTTYEFRNITPVSGHRYNGIYLGSLSGTIGNSSTEVVLSFSTVYNVTYRNSSGDTVKTASKGEYTVEELYDKPDGSYFIGWAYQANATMFDVRPGEVLTLSEDVVLYPVYISHAQATSGEAVLIYNINDFPADGYTIAETTRDVSTTTTESDWSAWSEWLTAAVSGSDTVQVESRTAYGWYYFECPSCHAHMHGYGTCYTWCGGCGAATTAAGCQTTYDPTNWSVAQDWYGTTKYYAIINGERWFRWDDGGTQTQYRSRKLVTNTTTTNKTYPAYVIQPAVSPVETFTVTYHANGGSGAPASHSSNVVPEGWTAQQIPGQEVLEEKTQYRSRTKSTKTSTESSLPGWTLYDKSISGYGEWSDWSATPITASETLEVRTKTVPAVTKTVWHYSRDTANGYSTYAIGYYGNPEYITLDYRLTAMGTIDGHTRYGSYGTTLSNYWWNEYSEEQVVQAAYTAYSSREIKYNYFYYRWSDWSEYSDTAIAAEDGVEVQTRTVYRYAFGIKLSGTVPVRTGYTFQGWATTPYAATALYQPGDVAAINSNTTLYAVWKQDSYTVSYNANGGTGAPANQAKLYGTALTLSSTKPTRVNASAGNFTVTLDAAGGTVSTNKLTAARTTSYFFQNWNTAANGSGATYAPGASYTANAALTLYAQWSSNTTTASVTLPTLSRTGYTFQGWNTAASGTGASYSAGAAYTPNANVTLYAVWKQDSYTVSYNANGGTGAPANQTKLYGTALTLSSTKPTRVNASAGSFTVTLDAAGGTVSANKLTAARTISYSFQSWNTAANGSGATYAPGASYTANAALTLYAQWSSNTTTASVTLPTPSRTGYTFQGWNTAASGTGASYSAGAAYTPNANVTLYAVWKQDSYTVSYNANGGTGAPANQTKLYGTALTLSSTKPTRANASAGSFTVTLDAAGGTVSTNKLTAARTTSYSFQSWNTAANGSGATYAPGASYTANAALALYAQWSSNTTTASVTLPTPSRTGYTFQGWNTAASGTGTSYGAGAAYTPNANVTLYAVWKLNQSVSGTLSLGTARGSAGSEVVVDVTLDKNPGIIALNFHFDYDQGKLEFLGGEEGILTGWTFSTSGKGALWDSDVDSVSTGTIAKLRFRILDNAEEGNAAIRLTDLMAGNRNEEEIFLATADGTITISNRIPGDMTDDGKVNIMDLIRLRKYLAGDNVSINLSNADVTGDGKVNVMDLIRLRKYLAGDDVELK